MKKIIQFPFPIFIAKENKWFVAECPILNIATQGRTEKEVKENMEDLIKECLKDSDVPKPKLKEMVPPSLTYISLPVSFEIFYGKT
jgi:predicted RNase H-like HicB family nuclease